VELAYDASGGREVFFSWEAPETDTIVGYLRLRFPSANTEGALDAPVIRELKVLGREVPVGGVSAEAGQYQHRGFGRSLLERAEERVRSTGFDRVYVTSAVGTREYYRARGYERSGPHMVKRLTGPAS